MNVSEHKLLAIYVQKHSIPNIACNLWKIKFPEATILENFEIP